MWSDKQPVNLGLDEELALLCRSADGQMRWNETDLMVISLAV
jgi:hypothetical protein